VRRGALGQGEKGATMVPAAGAWAGDAPGGNAQLSKRRAEGALGGCRVTVTVVLAAVAGTREETRASNTRTRCGSRGARGGERQQGKRKVE
jgi:hypothetical protein